MVGLQANQTAIPRPELWHTASPTASARTEGLRILGGSRVLLTTIKRNRVQGLGFRFLRGKGGLRGLISASREGRLR